MSAPSRGDRFRLLAAVGEVSDDTGLLGETVQRLLDILVPAFADVATIDVTSATGEMRRLAARVENPKDPELESALLHRHQSGDRSVGVLRVVATGESQLFAPVDETTLRRIATNDADLAMFRALDLRSTMYVPIAARGRTLGVLACSVRGPRRRFSAEDLQLGEALASRIGVALDNAGLSQAVVGLERRLEATLANLAAGVVVRGPGGRMLIANPAAARLLGAGSVEELFAFTPEQMMESFVAHDEAGTLVTFEQLPSMRALRGERPAPMVMRSLSRWNGAVRWLLHKATPVFDDQGELTMVVNVIEDVTEQKRAELAQRLLAEAGRTLSSSLDYEQTLQRVARLAVPGLADWCGVSIREDGDELEQVAVAHIDPDKVALAREFGRRYPTRVDDPSGAAEVLRSGVSQLVPEITDEVIAASDATEEQLEIVRDLAMRAVIIVPLAIPNRRPFGTLSLVMAESGRRFDEDDLAIAEELGRRAAMAVENARLYTERSRIATALQRGLLPPELPEVPGFRLASLYRPAGAESQVGGDFYDAFPIADGWIVLVGDVAGHGAEAAALTALSRHTLRTAGRLLGEPSAVAEQLNLALRELPQLSLVSLCCAALRIADGSARAEVLLAGHPTAFRVRGEELAPAGAPSPLLGIDDDCRWRTAPVSLEPGDLLVLYTDGVIDTFGESGRFGEERLVQTLRGAADADDAIDRVETALSAFAHGPQRDDTAVLVVERLPLPVSAGVVPGEAAPDLSAPVA